MPEILELNTLRSVEDLTDYQKQIRERMTELHKEKDGLPFDKDEQAEFARWKMVDAQISERVDELEARKKVIERISEKGASALERAEEETLRSQPQSLKERDIYDWSTFRSSIANPSAFRQEIHDRVRRSVERATFPLTVTREDQRAFGFTPDQARSHVDSLLARDNEDGLFARYLLSTGDPDYHRGYVKTMNAMQRGVPAYTLTPNESRAVERAMLAARALGLSSTGLPVPYQLDPTVVPTSNGSVNPYRTICRIEQVVVNEWRGATSGAITAQYRAEGVEATDNTPTMAQPVIPAVRADAFVPFSIEVGQDWGALQTEMARGIAEAKDDLEATKFNTGTGTNEPTGLDSMSVGTNVTSATLNVFAIADVYSLEAALPARFRARASILGTRAVYSKIRQFDTGGGAGLWIRIGDGLRNVPNGALGEGLLGYPTFESTSMDTAVTTGNRVLLMGDFRYYVIVERVGMSIEIIQHLFGATNRYPTGQRGLFAFWRNGGEPLSENAFKFLIIQ